MKRSLFSVKYPKLTLLILTFVAAYFLFKGKDLPAFSSALLSLGYFGTFLSGIFFSYGFTAAPATAVLLMLASSQDIVLASIVGGIGAMFGDLIIFNFIRTSFSNEFRRLSRERLVRYAASGVPGVAKRYLLPVVAGFIIASPFPDELGVSLLAASANVSLRAFSALSFLLNTSGIFIIIAVGKVV